MTSRERVLAALRLQEPDRVPWVESSVHPKLAEKLRRRSDFENTTLPPVSTVPGSRIAPEVLEVLALDNLVFSILPPRFVQSRDLEGLDMIGDGLIKTEADLEKIKLPDPEAEELYRPAKEFIARHRDSGKALGVITRLGISSTYLSMGIEHFSLMLYDRPQFVLEVMDRFVDWACRAVSRINKLGFDFLILPEDLAWKKGPLFSPATIRELFLPRMKKVAERIEIPWIYHSDGNLLPLIDDLLTLGMNGLANIEPGAMDILDLKKRYGRRICLMGNIDLRYTLTQGTPEETEAEVRKRIEELAPGGGYILASSNSLTHYCKPENILAMSRALLKYGSYGRR